MATLTVECTTNTTPAVIPSSNDILREKRQSLPQIAPPPPRSSTLAPPVPSKAIKKSPSNGWLKRSNTSIDRTNASASTSTIVSEKTLVVPFRPQSILLLPAPALVQSPKSDSPETEGQNNLIRTRNSSSTSTSSSSGATDTSTSTSASDCSQNSTASSTCSTSTSLTSTSPPTIHAPSSSVAPCVTFAPLPSIAPRKRKSNRPLGVAARATLLRQRHQYQYQYYEQQDRSYEYDGQPGYNYSDQIYEGQHHVVEVEEQRKREKEKPKSGKRKGGKRSEERQEDGQATLLSEQDDAFASLGKLLNDASRSLWRRFSQRNPSSSKPTPLPSAPSVPDVLNSTPSPTSTKKGPGSSGLLRLSSVSVRTKKSKKKHIVADELADPTTLGGVEELDSDDDDGKRASGNWKSPKRSEDPMTKTIRIDSDDEQEISVITAPARLTAQDVRDLEDVTTRCDLEDDILVGHSPSLDLERAHGEIHSPTVEVHIVAENSDDSSS